MSFFSFYKDVFIKSLINYCLCSFLFFIFCARSFAQNDPDSLLSILNNTISASSKYDAQKRDYIRKLKENPGTDKSSGSFDHFLELYSQYQVFNYDSAYTYAVKMQKMAALTGDDSLIDYAKIKLSFILLSSGMFKEVFDVLHTISLQHLSDAQKAEYYTVSARYYYDLADYDKDDFYSPAYNLQGNSYIDSSLLLYPESSFEYVYYNGLKNIRSGKNEQAFIYFDTLMHLPLTPHQFAITASTLSDIYIQKGHTDTAITLLIRAAVSDIQSSTKETSAALNLATLLFKQGDLKNASTYIEKAVNDALFYGARQRKVQLSAILPLIEAEKLNIVEKEKRNAIIYGIAVTLLFLLLIGFAIIIFRQVKKLQKAKQIITEANMQQKVINQKLLESNKIKEEYIGYFFSGNSEFYTKIEKFKKSVDQKIVDRKLDDIRFLVNNLNLKKERDELLKNFDQIFLKLFPNFTTEFNALIKEDDQIKLKEGELLNTDFRIFALIRMGIHDTDKIAAILGYSVNTINTYKTKIKNKSVIPNEEFEERIMHIESV